MKKNSGFVFIILSIFIVILFCAAVAVAFFVSQTKNIQSKQRSETVPINKDLKGTEAWNTYVSNDYYFSFEYPPEYKIYAVSSEAPQMTSDNANNLYVSDPSAPEPFITKLIQFDKQPYPVVYVNQTKTIETLKEGYDAEKYTTSLPNVFIYRIFQPYVGTIDITVDTSKKDALAILKTFRFVSREDMGYTCINNELGLKGTTPVTSWKCSPPNASEMSFTKKNIKIQISKNEYTSKCTAACKSVSSLGTRSLDGSFSSQIKTYTADNQLVELRGTTSTGLYIYSDLKSVSALTIQDNAEITLILNNLKPL